MAYTRLSPIALPGIPYSFSAKTAAGAGTHTGTFTQLGVSALPFMRYSFSAKTAETAHTGTFTQLGLIGLPFSRYSFSAKTEAEAEAPVETEQRVVSPVSIGGVETYIEYQQPVYDDQEVMEIIMTLVGLLYE